MIDDVLKRLFSKITSARFMMTLLFSATYCLGVIYALYLTAKGVLKVETFLGIWAGFTPLVILIAEWYFKREDRKGGEQ